MNWTQEQAIALCKTLEEVAPSYGIHIALTGGCLYGGQTGNVDNRKDCDIILYRIRQKEMDLPGFFKLIENKGVTRLDDNKNPWCHKFQSTIWPFGLIDFLIPEAPRPEKLEEEPGYQGE